MITSNISRSMVEKFFLLKYFPQEMDIEDARRELRERELADGEALKKAQKRFEELNPYEPRVVTKEVNGDVYTFQRRADGIWVITHVEFKDPYSRWRARHRRRG